MIDQALERLDATMRQVLAELELVSHGTVARPASGGGDSDSVFPPGEIRPPHLRRRRVYDAAATDDERRQCIKAAQGELAAIRGTAVIRTVFVGETRADRNARIAKHGERWPPREVAIRFRCAERDVINARMAAGRDPSDGTLPKAVTTPAERDAEIRRLAGRGISQRQIAAALHVGKGTIDRALQSAMEEA